MAKTYGLFSDPHSNLPALWTVLCHMREEFNPDEIWCLGDVVGYGAWPYECAALTVKYANVMLRGNHDDALVNEESFAELNDYAKDGILYSRQNLLHRDMQLAKFIFDAPFVHQVGKIVATHARLKFEGDQLKFGYIDKLDVLRKQFEELEKRNANVLFVGHSHSPVVIGEARHICHTKEIGSLFALNGQKWVVNVGSVGQPRDKNPAACYGILFVDDDENMFFRHVRVEYDIESAVKKYLEVGLPKFLATRLYDGR